MIIISIYKYDGNKTLYRVIKNDMQCILNTGYYCDDCDYTPAIDILVIKHIDRHHLNDIKICVLQCTNKCNLALIEKFKCC